MKTNDIKQLNLIKLVKGVKVNV